MRRRPLAKSTGTREPKFLYRGTDSAARARDLGIRLSGNALLVFGCAAGRENQVGVCIDKAWQDHAAAEVQLFGPTRFLHPFDAATRADCSDAVSVDQQRAIADEPQFRQGFPASRDRTPQREQLRAAGYQPIGHMSGPDTNAYICKTLPHTMSRRSEQRRFHSGFA